MKEETLALNETFDQFRYYCKFHEYYQRYTNNEVIFGGKPLGKRGVDYGHIKCTHPKTATGWCKENHDPRNCPRLEVLYV